MFIHILVYRKLTTYALTGSNGCEAYKGYTSAARIILCVSYNRNPENNRRPPYMATEYRPAPRAVVGGRNMDPGRNQFNLFLLQ
jgi:hypothetical protein